MANKTVIEYVMAELVSDDGKRTYTPKLKLQVTEMFVNEKTDPVKRAVARHELSSMSGMVIEDGIYKLRYMFDGQQQESRVKIQGGKMFAA